MWGPHFEPEPIEKIRKAQWSAENTAETQRVVDRLVTLREAMRVTSGDKTPAISALSAAIERFKQLDRNVTTDWKKP
jgi:hypothetical protein